MKPTRWQAKVWVDTVLEIIINRTIFEWYDEGVYSETSHFNMNARQIGEFFPGFAGAYETWKRVKNNFNQQILVQEAEKVFLALPVPYEHPDICYELDAAEEKIALLEEENAKLREQNDAIVEARVELSKQVAQLEKDLENSEKARQQGWNEANELRPRVKRLEDLLSRSIRVEDADFDGERGCSFILGEDHVVAEWRGDGIASDTVFSEHPALEYGLTTTPHIRCERMAFDMAHWPILCAMVSGPGDGQMKEISWWLDGEEDEE